MRLPFGWIGVQFFFVLSGYLITGILLRHRAQRLGPFLSSFYIRRSLRIFPIYFAYVGALILVAAAAARWAPRITASTAGLPLAQTSDQWPYLVTYTYNFASVIQYLRGEAITSSPFISHLWSLAIEEQFYLLFPLVVYWSRGTALPLALSLVVAGVPVLRFLAGRALIGLGWPPGVIGHHVLYTCTPFQIDSLALGGLLAVIGRERLAAWRRAPMVALGVLSGGWLLASWLYWQGPSRGFGLDSPAALMTHGRYIYAYSAVNLAGGALVAGALGDGGLATLLRARWLVYLGRLSYGMYLYHTAVKFIVLESAMYTVGGPRLRSLIAQQPVCELALFATFLLATVAVAAVSYHLLEARFLRLKDVWAPADAT